MLPETKAKIKKTLLYTLTAFTAFLIVFTIFFVIAIVIPAKSLYSQTQLLLNRQNDVKAALASKDLSQIKTQINLLRTDHTKIAQKYNGLAVLKVIPFANLYYSDGQSMLLIAKDSLDTAEIVVKAIEPYQDFLGLKGEATSSAKTTEDRIEFLTDSIESLVPQLDTIEAKVAEIEVALNKIDPDRYPETFRGLTLKSNLIKAQETVTSSHKLLKDGQPMLKKISWLLGKDAPRNYFLLFQNDAELRPTGGFWTAYGILKVDKGKITPVVSDDIYALDEKFKSTIPAPRPLKAYHINVPYWNLRDMNLSPDFPTSIATFIENYEKINNDKFDAIVALDTQVLVSFVKVLGRIGVPGWGNFTPDPDPRCNGCPQIIYQLEYIAGKPRNYIETNRKGFLGPLMHSLLANAMGSPKEKIGPLAQNILNDIYKKHVLFYFKDPEIQKAAIMANIAGAISPVDVNTDYFHLNDANMSSAKTNLFLTQKIKHEITSNGGKVDHKVAVTYTNPSPASNCNLEKGDLCLNAPKYRNWFRFYTPTGSQLVKLVGSEVEPVVYEELGKQVFEGFYGNKYPLYAQSSTKVTIQYTSATKPSANYQLLLQKQPGTKPIEYELWVNGQKQEIFNWETDKTLKLPL